MKVVIFSEDEYTDHCDCNDGICLKCGSIKFGDCEPDAENYKCDVCDSRSVMGFEMALVAGYIEIS